MLDGKRDTFWHSQWLNGGGATGVSPLPHTIDIVMGGQVNRVSGLRYLPRQDTLKTGHCGRWEIRLSSDGAAQRFGDARNVSVHAMLQHTSAIPRWRRAADHNFACIIVSCGCSALACCKASSCITQRTISTNTHMCLAIACLRQP